MNSCKPLKYAKLFEKFYFSNHRHGTEIENFYAKQEVLAYRLFNLSLFYVDVDSYFLRKQFTDCFQSIPTETGFRSI